MNKLITKLRKSAKISQEELAKHLKISRPTLISIEKGERDITITELRQLSRIFDIPVEIILDEQLSMKEKMNSQDFSKKAFQRFYNLILQCIKYGSGKDGKITKTKLAKLVYLCDFASYYKHLAPISGFEYRRLEQGPVAIEFFDILDTNESICIEKKDKAILVSLAEQPNETLFTDEENKLIKFICKKWQKADTHAIVDFTHKQIPWAMCRPREVIPYQLINMESPENVY